MYILDLARARKHWCDRHSKLPKQPVVKVGLLGTPFKQTGPGWPRIWICMPRWHGLGHHGPKLVCKMLEAFQNLFSQNFLIFLHFLSPDYVYKSKCVWLTRHGIPLMCFGQKTRSRSCTCLQCKHTSHQVHDMHQGSYSRSSRGVLAFDPPPLASPEEEDCTPSTEQKAFQSLIPNI